MRFNAIGKITDEMKAMMALVNAFIDAELDSADLEPGTGLVQRARNAGTVISVVVIGVVALVGILIFAQVEDATPDLNGSPLETSQNSVTEGFGSAIEFVPIIMLVMLASVVIIVVQRMRN